MSGDNNSFVRKEMISERIPPAAERGLVKWVRENLFSSAFNTIMTFVSLWFIYSIVVAAAPWFLNGIWDAETVRECYDLLDGKRGGCFAVSIIHFKSLIKNKRGGKTYWYYIFLSKNTIVPLFITIILWHIIID